jgi:hypothetical protein
MYRVGGSMGAEKKYVDGYLDSTNIVEVDDNDATWAGCELNPRQQTAVYGCLPVPRQGTNYADRDGRRIMIKSIRIWGFVSWSSENALGAAATPGAPVRLLLVQDKNTCGAELSAENVIGPGLGSDGQATLSGDSALMLPTNPDGWGRYIVKKQLMIDCPQKLAYQDGTDGAIPGWKVPFSMKIKVNTVVNFNASTGAVGSIIDNSFHLIGATGGEPDTVISYYCRVSFIG